MRGRKSGFVYPVIAALISACLIAAAFFFLSRGQNEGNSSEQDDALESSQQKTLKNPFKFPENGGLLFQDPTELITYVREMLVTGDSERLKAVLSHLEGVEGEVNIYENLKQYKGQDLQVREIGELEINEQSRWSITSKEVDGEVLLDLQALSGKGWHVGAIQLTDKGKVVYSTLDTNDDSHSLIVADRFLKALINQDYRKAMSLVDLNYISGARISSLCVIFEEGNYALPSRKSLRSLFRREGVAGYMINLKIPDSDEKGQLGVTLKKEEASSTWKVAEVNLNDLLAEQMRRVGGSDAYYTPLVKTPKGGDNLVIYFDSNKTGLTKRAQKQLNIVAQMLKFDPTKVITLGGHADAVGSNKDNDALSLARALEVEKCLIKEGVAESQVEVLAYGESMPVLSNDSDIGRRVNRRAEIYLDF